jgi:argininosuccinate lyase
MRAAYAHVNRNPLGAAALATSSFAIDRKRLEALLGFSGLVENAYDANHLAPVDSALEVAGVLAIAAVEIGMFAQDIHAQYANPTPWFVLGGAELTGVSSIMPQKRNPAALEQLRAQASIMLSEMQTFFLLSHNNRTGMFDYRGYDPVPCGRPLQVLRLFAQVIDGIVVNKARALDEVRAEYSTTTELADALMQRADVPFRVGHHFASKLTDFGRGHGLRIHEIPYADAARLYRDQAGSDLPLTEKDFREVLSPEYMVFGRKGLGGPQLAEVARMLGDEHGDLAAERDWIERQRHHLAAAGATLEAAFTALAAA